MTKKRCSQKHVKEPYKEAYLENNKIIEALRKRADDRQAAIKDLRKKFQDEKLSLRKEDDSKKQDRTIASLEELRTQLKVEYYNLQICKKKEKRHIERSKTELGDWELEPFSRYC